MYYIAPTGIGFGIKYAVTNWSIIVTDSSTHALLGATDLIWILLLARIINKEKLGILEALAVIVCIVGTFLVAYDKAKAVQDSFVPIFAKLLAPFIGAFCVSTLRSGVKGLYEPSNRLQGTTTQVEFTAIKLTLSTLAAFICGMIFENGVVHVTNSAKKLPDAWWVGLTNYPAKGTMLVLASGILTFVFHVNLAYLATTTSAMAVGLMQEVKVLPQYGFNAIFVALGVSGLAVSMTSMSLAGAVLSLLGSVLYAFASHVSHTKGKLWLGRRGPEWVKEESATGPPDAFSDSQARVSPLESGLTVSL